MTDMTPRWCAKFDVANSLEDLPPGSQELFEQEDQISLSYDWFLNVTQNGLSPNTEAHFGVLSVSERIVAIIPLARHPNSTLSSLTNCYTCLYHPLVLRKGSLSDTAELLGQALGKYCSRYALLQLDCLPMSWLGLNPFIAGIRDTGLAVRQFHQFGNWYEPINDRSWEEYLASRPGSLRELLRRRGRKAADNRLCFEVIRDEDNLARGIAAYETVYQRSWKPAEPFPAFNPKLMRCATQLGLLRLGLCWREEKPIAAQIWIVENGNATVHKLAHDDSERSVSPGTLLTAKMVERLISEGINEIDFGRGDDWYKHLWAGYRRERIGLIVANPKRIRGLRTLAVHDIGRATRGLRHSFRAYRASRTQANVRT